jgi:carboxypeptidase T
MWYLLENYGTNPEVTYLVDHTEMYFIPVINPDGYIRNETTNPNGGGMWRKNRRPNSNGTFGVDLNRNYSYAWGTTGISTNMASDIYCGPSAFSEPETQAVKAFVENRDFKIALNYHTYGNMLLHPFGHANLQTADDGQFNLWGSWLVRQNGYNSMLSANLYPASGDSDDWMYAGDLATKPKIFAFTPEVGSDVHQFWPPQSQILPLCRENLVQNLTAAHLLLDYGKVTDRSKQIYASLNDYIRYDFTQMGLLPGTFTVSIAPVGFGVAGTGAAKVHSGLVVGQTVLDSITVVLEPTLQPGQTFRVALSWTNGDYTYSDTLTKTYGQSQTVFADNGSAMTNWTGTGWGTTTAHFVSAPSSITDSPGGNYANNANSTLTLNSAVDLTNAIYAEISFYARWDIEKAYDYAQLQASTDGGTTWQALCGLYTSTGTANQDNGKPLWDGTQLGWVKERVSLADYIGQNIRLRFRFRSDGGVVADGFYFDDFEITQIDQAPQNVLERQLPDINVFPNPASDFVKVQYNTSEHAHLYLVDVSGN